MTTEANEYFDSLKERINENWDFHIHQFIDACKCNGLERQLISYLNVEQLDAFKHCCDNLDYRFGNQATCRTICNILQEQHKRLFPRLGFYLYRKSLYASDREYLLRCAFSLREPSSSYLRKLIITWFAIKRMQQDSTTYYNNLDDILTYCEMLCRILNTITYDCKKPNAEFGCRTFKRNFC